MWTEPSENWLGVLRAFGDEAMKTNCTICLLALLGLLSVAALAQNEDVASPLELEQDYYQVKTVGNDLIFTVNKVSFTMKHIGGGSFQMGNASNDAYKDEQPVHKVTVSSFYMGETEVTQALWQAVMGDNPSRFKGSNHPVENVSWNDCNEFIKKLNEITSHQFRLPTEAEWEYAARGGKKGHGYKYSGKNTIGSIAWYIDNSDNKTHTVKGKLPNELGLYDMCGNVWEWCSDWYDHYSGNSQIDPQGSYSGIYPILRGGCWNSNDWYCRVTNRSYNNPKFSGDGYGFRLALITDTIN